MAFEMFPAELRALPQWMVAGAGDASSPDYKRPLDPKTGRWGSPTDPATWGTFEQAMASPYPLKGFVFHESDDFAVIDLDTYKAKSDEVRNLHGEIKRHAVTYQELSQSGLGTHIIGRGRVPEGANNEANSLEVYSHARFMICTGNVGSEGVQRPIADIQELLDYLYPLLKNGGKHPSVNWRDLDAGTDSGLSDAELVERARNAENGDKFDRLCQGDLSDYGGDWSDADMALIQFLCFYSTDNVQVARLFMMSKLAERDKAQERPDYVPRTILRARQMLKNDQPPDVDASAMIERARAAAIPAPAPADSAPIAPPPVTRPATFPPGLIGEVAEYVLQSAIRPVPEIALATAIASVAGVAARNYNFSTPPTGLNQYILLLAKTGTGKESVQSSIDKLFAEVQKTIPAADRFLGPANFASGQALVKQFQERPCFVSVLGEFGHRIKAMSDPRANGAEKTLMMAMLDIFGKSGWSQMMRSSVYSDKEKNTSVVHAPALTLLGETAPEPFFAGLSEGLIESGFLPRFLTIEYTGERPAINKRALPSPPPALVERMSALCATVLQMEQNATAFTVAADAAGLHMLDLFNEYVDEQMFGAGEVTRQLWNRAHLKALRLAALVAVGVNHYAPVVTSVEATWAINMVKRDVTVLHTRFISGDVGEGDSKHHADLVRVIKQYFREGYKGFEHYHERGAIPKTVLSRRTLNLSAFKNDRRGATTALNAAIQLMLDTGVLTVIPKAQATEWFKSASMAYSLGEHWSA